MKIFMNQSQESLEKKFMDIHCNALPMGSMGPHWVYCKYLFSNKILCDKMHIIGKLVNFYIDSGNKLSNIENVS
jgi:hypothetical protein